MKPSPSTRTNDIGAPKSPRLLSVPEAAAYLNTSPRHIRRLVHERRVPFIKLGPGRNARVRFAADHLDACLEEHTTAPEVP